ncbi:MAG: hypothetical protein IJD79_05625 [Clostridia bacterium]|nr:hypothetical protein [Clostridia bacterium]
MKKIIIYLLAITLLITGILGLSSCRLKDDVESTYSLETDGFNKTVAFGEKISYDKLTIIKTTGKNESVIPVEASMIKTPVDTNKVGNQELVIVYEENEFSLKITVKYKAEFKVDGEIYETKYVLSPLELITVKAPEKEGKTFSGWSPAIPEVATGNMVFEAIYADSVPALEEINAEYSDKLANIVLPSNEFGKWVFVNAEGTVGELGVHEFDVKFVDNKSGNEIKTDKVTVNVAKKKVTFSNLVTTFTYNGKSQIPTFTPSAPVSVVFIGDETATNAGEYEYYFEVDDPNYEGVLQGVYVIDKAKVKVNVKSYEMFINDEFPKVEYTVEGFDDIALLGITTTDPEDVVDAAGEYTLTATVANPNVEATVIDGKLTVKSTTLDVGDPKLITAGTLYYEDLLSSISFESHPNGEWVWKNPGDTVGNAGTNVHVAVFYPTDTRYDAIEKEVEISVEKKPIIITITSETTYDYNGEDRLLTYALEDADGKDYNHLTVTGNKAYTNAGTYTLTLEIADDNYTGILQPTLIINKINPKTDFTAEFNTTWSSTLRLSDLALDSGYAWVNPDERITTAGTHTFAAKYTPSDIQNYNTVQGNFTVVVGKASASINNVNSSYNFTYSGSAFKLDEITASHSESSLKFAFTKNGATVFTLKDAGTYSVTVTLPESTNHLSATATTTVIINKADIDTSSVSVSQNATYGDKLLEKITLPVSALGTWSIKDANADTTVGNAGANKFTATFTPNTENYNTAEVEITVNVSKKQITPPTVADAMREQEYTGSKLYSGIAAGEGYTVTDNGGINVGTYNVILALVSDNYVWIDGTSADKTVTFKIVSAANSWTTAPTIKSEWVYGETDGIDKESEAYKAYTGYAVAKYGTVTVLYAEAGSDEFTSTLPTNAGAYVASFTATYANATTISEDISFTITKRGVDVPTYTDTYTYTGSGINAGIAASDLYSVNDPKHTDAGSYSASITLADTKNYTWADGDTSATKQLPYTINKAQIVISGLTLADFVYGGTAAPTASTNFVCTLSYVYSSTESGEFTSTVPTNAGTYYVKAVAAGNENLIGAESAAVKFVIEKANATINGYNDTYNTVYSGNEYKITGVTASNGVALTYTYTKGGVSVEKIVDAGTYRVKITLPETANYNEASVTVTVTVAKADISTADVNVNQNATYGDKLLEKITLPVNALGTWSINGANTDTTVGNAGANKFTATFTPNTENYNTAEIEITVNVDKATVELPIVTDKIYDGTSHNSGLTDTDKYTVTSDIGGTDKGTYTVTIALIDTDNYKWESTSNASVTISYQIAAAINSWTTVPSITPSWEYESSGTVAGEAAYGEVLVQYKLESAPDSAYSTEIPTLPGNYVAKFTTTDENYSILTLTRNFTITKKTVTVPTVGNNQFTYTGSVISLDIAQGADYTVVDAGGTNVGNYVAEVTLNNANYVWSDGDENLTKEFNYSIVKADVTFSDLAIEGWTYDGTASVPTVSTSFACDVYYLYASKTNGTYTATVPTNAGTYYVKAVTDGNGNLNKSESAPVEFTVAKASTTIGGYESSYSKTYDGTEFVFTDKNITSSNDVALIYSYTLNGGNVSAIKNAGTYTVLITLPESDNYLGDSVTVTVVIDKANIDTSDVLTTQNATYGDKLLEKITLPASTLGTWSIKDANANTTVGDAGSKKFTAVFTASDSNYNSTEVEITVNVAKKTVTVPAVKNPTSVYDNTTHYSGLTDTDEYTVTDNGGINVGTYTVTLTLKNTNNYAWTTVDNTNATVTVSYVITKGENAWTTAPAMPSWTYGDATGAGSAAAKWGDVLVEYKLASADDTAYSTTVPTNAGSYIARFTTTSTNCETLTDTRTFTISRRTVTVPSPAFTSTTYTGNKITSGITANDYYTVVDNGGTNVGTYSVTVTLKDTVNTRWNKSENDTAPISYTYSITQATVTFSGLTASWSYGNFKAPTVTVSFPCDVVFLYSDTANGTFAEKTEEELNSFTAGTHYVKAVVYETTNYKTSESAPVAFLIERATPTFDDPYFVAEDKNYQNMLNLSGNQYYNDELGAYLAYNEGNTSKPLTGTYTYGTVNFADGVKASSVTLTFTPDDTANYTTVTKTYNMTLVSVAYLNNTTPYGTIEAAINAANVAGSGTVWVRPHDAALGPIYIKEDISINAGVTLLLPFGTTNDANGKNQSSVATLSTGSLAGDNLCMTKVILADGKTITNRGTIEISGLLSGGSGGSNYASHTAGKHAKLLLGASAKINSLSGSRILCYGFIEELDENNGSSVTIKSGASLDQPFTLRDFRGGSYMAAVYYALRNDLRYAPFNMFQFLNVTPKMTIEYGGTMNAIVNLIAGGKTSNQSVVMIGYNASAVLQLTDRTNSYLTAKFTKSTQICDLHIFGGAKTNGMKVKVDAGISVSIDTQNTMFPISHYFHVQLSNNTANNQTDARYYMNQNFKFLPGSKLTIDEGVTLNANLLIFYESFTDTCAIGNKYPSNKAPAELNLSGTLICTELGAKINVLSETAKIIISGSTSSHAYEVISISGSSILSSVGDKQTITVNTTIVYKNAENAIDQTLTVSTPGAYVYNGDTKQYEQSEYVFIVVGEGCKVTVPGFIYDATGTPLIETPGYDSSTGEYTEFFVEAGTEVTYTYLAGYYLDISNKTYTSYPLEGGTEPWTATLDATAQVLKIPTIEITTGEGFYVVVDGYVLDESGNVISKEGITTTKGDNSTIYVYEFTKVTFYYDAGYYPFLDDEAITSYPSAANSRVWTASTAGMIKVVKVPSVNVTVDSSIVDYDSYTIAYSAYGAAVNVTKAYVAKSATSNTKTVKMYTSDGTLSATCDTVDSTQVSGFLFGTKKYNYHCTMTLAGIVNDCTVYITAVEK